MKRRNFLRSGGTAAVAGLYRKSNGSEARLSYLGHIAVEHRNGLIVGAMVTQADGTAEREAAKKMARPSGDTSKPAKEGHLKTGQRN